jgi:hypothetical protein
VLMQADDKRRKTHASKTGAPRPEPLGGKLNRPVCRIEDWRCAFDLLLHAYLWCAVSDFVILRSNAGFT